MSYDGEGDCPLEMIIEIDEGEIEDRNFCHDDKKEEVHMVQHIDPTTSTIEYEHSDNHSNNVKSDESYSITPDPTGNTVQPEVLYTPSTKVQVQRLSGDFLSSSSTTIKGKGRGEKLGKIPSVCAQLDKFSEDELLPLHRVMYCRPGRISMTMLKESMKKFCGFPADDNDYQLRKTRELLSRKDAKTLSFMCEILCLRPTKEREDMITKILFFLSKPNAEAIEIQVEPVRDEVDNTSDVDEFTPHDATSSDEEITSEQKNGQNFIPPIAEFPKKVETQIIHITQGVFGNQDTTSGNRPEIKKFNFIKPQIISPAQPLIDQDFEKKFKEFPEIDMNIKTAENKLLQIMFQLLFNVKAKDEPSVLIEKILDFSRVSFPSHGEGYVQRELFLLLRTRDELVHITRLLGIPSKTENRKMIDDIMAFLTKSKKSSNQGKAVTCVQMKPPEGLKEKTEDKSQDIQHMQKIGRARKSCSWPTQKKDPDFVTPVHQPVQSPLPSVASRTRSNQYKSTLDLLKDPPPPKKAKYYASDPDSGDDNIDDPLEHPTDEELQRQIQKIMSETNLEPIWMNMVEKVLQHYPKFDLQYRREFVKTTVKQLVGKKLLSQTL